MSYERGDVVIALDPFVQAERGRPFVIISTADIPFHGEQYLAASLTTRTWHAEGIPVPTEKWTRGGAPKASAIMPWSLNSLKHEWVDTYQGRLRSTVVDEAVNALDDWIHA